MTDHNISDNESASLSTKHQRKTKNSMPIKLDIPNPEILKPKITIFGVGGAGGNALNNMIRSNLEGVEFVAANTDSQAISHSLTENRIQLGVRTTKGLGAGSFPDRGRMAAEENIDEIEKYLEGCNMVFIAAGMGGGTGTGAAPVIAKLAREREILTVGVVTKPFHFEGKYRMETAEAGIEELKKHVDTLIVIPNQNLFRIANENTTFESAFKMADDVLQAGVRGVTDLITMPGLVNLDFADIRTIMTKMGKAMMGTGEASGENRAVLACEAAIANPLLDDISIKGAKGVLVNMTGGPDMTLFEADMAVNTIRKEVDANANIIFGSAFHENMKGKIRISVVATGIDSEEFRRDNYAKNKEIHEPSRFRSQILNDHKNSHETFFDPGVPAKNNKVVIEEISDENFKPKRVYNKEENINYGLTNSEPSISKKTQHHSHSNPHNQESVNHDSAINHAKNSHKFETDATEYFDNNHSNTSNENQIKSNHNHISKNDDHDNIFKSPIEDNDKIHDKKSTKNTKTKDKIKKESSGFSLFSFMNTKEKEEDIKFHEKSPSNHSKKAVMIDQENEFDDFATHNNTHPTNSSEAEKKRQQFFGNTIFDDNEADNDSGKIDDDIVNVPAFFRRKK